MDRGYIKLWRKVLTNPVFHERGKRYSRLEAWIYLCLEANGIEGKDGLRRGELAVSIRYLAKAWNWSKSAVERYIGELLRDSMINRLGQQAGHFEGHFIICKYELYNPMRDSLRDKKRDKSNEVFNEVEKNKDISCPPKTEDASVLLTIYAEENKKLPQVKARSHDRMAKCRSRINQAVRDGCLEQYLKDFRAAVSQAQSIPFLCGETDKSTWRADLDWFIANHTNVYRVLEGKYSNGTKPKQEDIFARLEREAIEGESQRSSIHEEPGGGLRQVASGRRND